MRTSTEVNYQLGMMNNTEEHRSTSIKSEVQDGFSNSTTACEREVVIPMPKVQLRSVDVFYFSVSLYTSTLSLAGS